ncbi:MAG: hypothetical protein WD425_01690 [Nitrospirales bacterium]
MFGAIPHPYLVSADDSFRTAAAPTRPPKSAPSQKGCEKRLQASIKDLDEFQRQRYAHDQYSLLLILQAMDAAGKDSAIRAMMRGMNPPGCQVFSFKQPSPQELDHDVLWRSTRCPR